MKLEVKSRYVNRNLGYDAGAVIEVSDAEARMLMADAPGVFVEYVEPEPKPKPQRKSRRAPARNKMVEEPVEEK